MTQQDRSTIRPEFEASGGVLSAEFPSPKYNSSPIDFITEFAYRKWLIARITGIAALLGVVLSLTLPVRYTAVTRIMPPQQTQSTTSLLMMNQAAGVSGSPLAAIASGGLSFKSPNDIYVGLLTSRPISDAIIQKFGLAKVYHAKDMTQARKELAGNSEVASEKSGFIAVSVTDKDKERAAAMANTYIDQLRTLTKTLAITEASRRRLFYEEQLKQTKSALVAAELAFQQVQQQKGLVQLDAQAKAMIEGIAALRAQVAAKQVEVQALRSYSTEQNPDVQLAKRELNSLQAEESRLEERNPKPGIARMGLQNIPSAGLEYLRAGHEAQFQQALYDILMKQYDAASLDEAKEAAVIQVVEPAIKPDQRSSPHRASMVLLFTLFGFLGACIFVLAVISARRNPEISQSFASLRKALLSR